MQFQPSTHSYGQWPPEDVQTTVPVSLWSPSEDIEATAPKPGFDAQMMGLGVGVGLIGLVLVGPLVVTPWIVKAFKPEWSYGRRVAAGFGVSAVLGAVSQIGRSK